MRENSLLTRDLGDVFDSILEIYRTFEQDRNRRNSDDELKDICLQYMQKTSRIYKYDLPRESDRVDFSDPLKQWSYMFVYTLRHVDLVSYALDATSDIGILTDSDACGSPTVCMIGGGPGSDVLGLCLHLREHGHTAPMSSGLHVLDKYTEWQSTWQLFHQHLPERFNLAIPEMEYHAFDFEDNDLSVEHQEIVKTSNIVTMIKSLSPVAAWLRTRKKLNRDGVETDDCTSVFEWHSVFSILKHMKPGAFLLYIDNRTGPQRRILMDAVECLDFEILYDSILYGQFLSNSVFSVSARVFMIEFGFNPCTVAGVNEVILLKKKSYSENVVDVDSILDS